MISKQGRRDARRVLELRGRRPRSAAAASRVILRMEKLGVPTYYELILRRAPRGPRRGGASKAPPLPAGHRARATGAARRTRAPGVDALLKADKGLDRGLQEAAVKATLPVFFPADEDQPFGWQEPAEWDAYGAGCTQNELLKRPPDAARALTNEFLPGEGLAPRADRDCREHARRRRRADRYSPARPFHGAVGREEPAHLGLVGARLRVPGGQPPDELDDSRGRPPATRSWRPRPEREHLDRPRPDLGDRAQPRPRPLAVARGPRGRRATSAPPGAAPARAGPRGRRPRSRPAPAPATAAGVGACRAAPSPRSGGRARRSAGAGSRPRARARSAAR